MDGDANSACLLKSSREPWCWVDPAGLCGAKSGTAEFADGWRCCAKPLVEFSPGWPGESSLAPSYFRRFGFGQPLTRRTLLAVRDLTRQVSPGYHDRTV